MNKHVSILLLLTTVSLFGVAAEPPAKPTSAKIVDIPAKFADSGIKAGNVKVLFSDGHSETWTHPGNCEKPHVAKEGAVGWVNFSALDGRGAELNDIVQLRFPDGTRKEFKPNSEAPFILDWGFADNESSVVIQSMQHHRPPYFIKYDIKTGRTTGTVDGYQPLRQTAEMGPAILGRKALALTTDTFKTYCAVLGHKA